MSVVERLRVLLAKKFKSGKIELLPPYPPEEWMMAVRLYPFDIFVTAYKNGKIEIDTGPEPTRSEISKRALENLRSLT